MITFWATVKWFLETFKMESVVMVVCVALGVGMIVTRVPQVWGMLAPQAPPIRFVPSAAVSPTVTPQPQAPTPQATMVAQQCQTEFQSFKQWAMQEGARSSAEKWREVQQRFYAMVTYCNQHLSQWTAPYQFVDLQQMARVPHTTHRALTTEEQRFQTECTAKMDEYRLWFANYGHIDAQPRKDARQQFQRWVEYCASRVPGWEQPFLLSKE